METTLAMWEAVRATATAEALNSPLPGVGNGPADAYRHLIGTAELRRRFGFVVAWSIVTGRDEPRLRWA